MAEVDQSDSARWAKANAKAGELIPRAGGHQCRQAGLDLFQEAKRLWSLYGMADKPSRWQDHGDVAFHLAAAYRPDLAYCLVYAFRDIRERPDPVPLIMTALEHLIHLRPTTISIHLPATVDLENLRRNPRELATRGARILAREVSVAPYAHATGIYAHWDSAAKSILVDALREFNPDGAAVLAKDSKAWMRTGTGFLSGTLHVLWRIFFGRAD